MSGNTIGALFRVTTWGESHGPAIGAVIDGCPPRLDLSEADIQEELDRRRPGTLPSASPRQEADRVEILSGVFEGKTTGTPISLMIRNSDAESAAYEGSPRSLPARPRGLSPTRRSTGSGTTGAAAAPRAGRRRAGSPPAPSPARSSAGRGSTVSAWTMELGGIAAEPLSLAAALIQPPLLPRPGGGAEMVKRLEEARAAGDTLGGIVEIVVRGCPPGLGEPVFGKIDADLAGALMGIGTVKGVEIGAGFAAPNDRLRLQRSHRTGRLPDKPRRGDPGGNHKRRARSSSGSRASPSPRSPGRRRRSTSGESRRRDHQRPSRRVGHPADHPGLRGDGLHRPRGSSPPSAGDHDRER